MPLEINQFIRANRYRIDAYLAKGGMGAVYRGWDTSLNIPVAIKENLVTTETSQKQFSMEAQILARLSHPNLPRVTDYFIVPDIGQYLVMDYIEGEDLQQMLKRLGVLPEPEALNWIAQVCDALAYLHSQPSPIIHRDIKPGNIKIKADGTAVLVDFGIAKVFDHATATTMGAKAVTPGYSPPEQYGNGTTDPRSDVYALGATLYTLLTGQQPPESIKRAVGSAELPAPRTLNPSISPQIERAIMRSTEVTTNRRYQRIEDLLEAIQLPNEPSYDAVRSQVYEPTRQPVGGFQDGGSGWTSAPASGPQSGPRSSPQSGPQSGPRSAPASGPRRVSQPVPSVQKKGLSPLAWVGILGGGGLMVVCAVVILALVFGGNLLNPDPTATAIVSAREVSTERPTPVPTELPSASPTPWPTDAPPTNTPVPTEMPTDRPTEEIVVVNPPVEIGFSAPALFADGIFELVVPNGWDVNEQAASVLLIDPSGIGFVNIAGTNTGYLLDSYGFENFVTEREINMFGEHENYTEVSREIDGDQGNATVTKSLDFDGIPQTVITLYEQYDQAILAMDFWADTDQYDPYLDYFDPIASSVVFNEAAMADYDVYNWITDFEAQDGMFQVEVPLEWSVIHEDGDDFYIDTFISPDDHGVIQAIVFTHLAPLSEAEAEAYVREMVSAVYGDNLRTISGEWSPEKTFSLEWHEDDALFSGMSYFDMRGNTSVIFSLVYDDEWEYVYSPVLDYTIGTYFVP